MSARPEAAGSPARWRPGRLSPGARLVVISAVIAVAATCFLLLFIRGSFAFSFERRAIMLGTMVVAAFAQGVGTVVFQTITQNRILTPSIMGFDSLYVLLQTTLVFAFGGTVIAKTEGLPKVLAQTALMVLFATLLYRWLLSGRFGNLYILLLVGVVFGLAFDSISVFLQRLLSPTDYDLLNATLYGRMGNLDATHLPLALLVCLAVGVALWRMRYRLDTMLLGRDVSMSLGIDYKRDMTVVLMLVALLVSFSTALVGPMTFFGFLAAHLAYQLAGSYKHQYVMPMAFLVGLLGLVGGQFILEHVFYAGGFLTIIIEFVGGIAFIIILLRTGKL